jgi:flagella basal body P-ring formation protein FlgA
MRRLLTSCLILGGLAVAAGRGAADAGPASVAAPLTREDFVTALAGNLTDHFNLEGELQLELNRAWLAPVQLAHRWSVAITEYPPMVAPSMLAHCRVHADGQLAGEYTLALRASLWRDAWTARQPVSANAIFDPALLEARRVDFLREREALPTTVGDHSFIFARSIQPHRLLTWRDVSRRPLVRKGELVEVAAIDGLLQVTMRGLALENGAAGDTVTIRNTETKKVISAQVVAENRVLIHF